MGKTSTLDAHDPKTLSQLECARARESVAMYGAITRGLGAAQHHLGIIHAVEAPVSAANGNVAIVCPPGSGKSTWISEIAPPWLIGNDPTKLILHVHANDEKANSYLGTLQQVFETNYAHQQIFPEVLPDSERGWSSKGLYFKWRDRTGKWPIVDKEGWAHQGAKDPQYVSIGYMGGAIGRRADVIILDDPFDPAEIDSPTWRVRFERRFKQVIMTRLKPGGRIIWVSNRWHEDDMVPKLTGMGFNLITFPAIIEIRDEDGQLLREESYWPEGYPLAYLQKLREDLDGEWPCLFQGVTVNNDTALFLRENFQYCEVDEGQRLIRIISEGRATEIIPFTACKFGQAVDPATTTNTYSDFFVIATMAFHNGRFFLVDMIRKKLTLPEQPDLLLEAYKKWHPAGQGIEKAGFQAGVVQLAKQKGIPVIELTRHNDKIERWKTGGYHYKNKMVYHRKGAPWLKDVENELCALPRARHDDAADAICDCMELLNGRAPSMNAKKRAQALARERTRVFAGGAW